MVFLFVLFIVVVIRDVLVMVIVIRVFVVENFLKRFDKLWKGRVRMNIVIIRIKGGINSFNRCSKRQGEIQVCSLFVIVNVRLRIKFVRVKGMMFFLIRFQISVMLMILSNVWDKNSVVQNRLIKIQVVKQCMIIFYVVLNRQVQLNRWFCIIVVLKGVLIKIKIQNVVGLKLILKILLMFVICKLV